MYGPRAKYSEVSEIKSKLKIVSSSWKRYAARSDIETANIKATLKRVEDKLTLFETSLGISASPDRDESVVETMGGTSRSWDQRDLSTRAIIADLIESALVQ